MNEPGLPPIVRGKGVPRGNPSSKRGTSQASAAATKKRRATAGNPAARIPTQQELRTIAIYQKCVQVAALVYLLMVVVVVASGDALEAFAPTIFLCAALVAAISNLLLANKLFGLMQAIAIGIFSLIPIIGLLLLLKVNGTATWLFRECGYKVGMLGVRLSDLD